MGIRMGMGFCLAIAMGFRMAMGCCLAIGMGFRIQMRMGCCMAMGCCICLHSMGCCLCLHTLLMLHKVHKVQDSIHKKEHRMEDKQTELGKEIQHNPKPRKPKNANNARVLSMVNDVRTTKLA